MQLVMNRIVTDIASQARLVSMSAGGSGSLHCFAGMLIFTGIAGMPNSHEIESYLTTSRLLAIFVGWKKSYVLYARSWQYYI